MNKNILMINSNSNPITTNWLQERIEKFVDPETKITVVNPDFGPQGVDTYMDWLIAGIETLKIVSSNKEKYDAFVIGCGSDPGLDACRQITTKPVLGLSESAMLMACPLGNKFSIISTRETQIPVLEQRVIQYGLRDKLASIRYIQMTTADLMNREELIKNTCEAAKIAVKKDRAEVIVLTGSLMLGTEKEISEASGVPVMLGVVCALKMAEIYISIGGTTSKAYKYQQVKKKDQLIGYQELREVYSI